MTGNLLTEVMGDICCPECGISYAVPKKWQLERRDDHKTFYCPNGHTQWYPGQNETELLRKQLEAEKARTTNLDAARIAAQEQAEHERRERKKMKTRHTNLRLRVKLGTCPCCNTQFPNLKTHMANAHPGFTPTDDQKVVKP